MFITSRILLLAIALVAAGCQTQRTPYDYSALRKSQPRSIVVIPPANNSIEVNAPYTFLSTISRPLAEKGYYVFPVAVIDTFLKENGLPTTDEMNAVPLDKIRQNIGADAVLYVTIEDWGQKYEVLHSRAVVQAKLRLVDARTGEQLWDAMAQAQQQSDDGGQGLIGALINAVVEQIVSSSVDRTPGLSSLANTIAINNPHSGLLNGPYVPEEAPPK